MPWLFNTETNHFLVRGAAEKGNFVFVLTLFYQGANKLDGVFCLQLRSKCSIYN